MKSATDFEQEIVSDVSKRAGVAEEEVRRVLEALDLSGCLRNMAETLAPETIERLGADRLKVRIRSGQTMVHA